MTRTPERIGRGVITVATGEMYRGEVLNLISSIKKNSPSLEITVFTDVSFLEHESSSVKEVVLDSPSFSFFDTIAAVKYRPYAQTLYLDCDTWVERNIENVFDLLVGCDFAAVHDSWRVSYLGSPPEVFPEPNTGVMLIGSSPSVDLLVGQWEQRFRTAERIAGTTNLVSDQHPLWESLWNLQCEGKIRFLALPTEWNIHLWHPISLAQNAKVAIVHGRGLSISEAARRLSRSSVARVWIPNSIGWNDERITTGIIAGRRIGKLAIPLLYAVSLTLKFLRSLSLR